MTEQRDWNAPLKDEDSNTYRSRLLANAKWGPDLDFAMTTGTRCGSRKRGHSATLNGVGWACTRCRKPLLKNPQGTWTAVPPARPVQGDLPR